MEPTPYELEQWEKRADQRKAERPGHYVERERLVPIIEKWLEDHRQRYDATQQGEKSWGKPRPGGAAGIQAAGALDTLAFMSGINQRMIGRILRPDSPTFRMKKNGRGETTRVLEAPAKYLTIDIVDRLLVGMELVHLFYLPPEDGGFADVYWHPSVVGDERVAA